MTDATLEPVPDLRPDTVAKRRLRAVAGNPAVLTVAAMFMWLVTEAAGAALMPDGISVPQIVWMRYAFHILLMVVIFGPPFRFSFVRTDRLGLQLARSLLMLVMPLSYAVAASAGDGLRVLGVFWLAPALVLVFAAGAGNRPTRGVWLTTCVATLGTAGGYGMLSSSMAWTTILAGLGMAASFAGYLILTRALDRTEPLLTNLFHTAVGVFIALTLVLPLYWVPVGPSTLIAGVIIAASGWVVLYFIDLAMRIARPSQLAPFLFTQALLELAYRHRWGSLQMPLALAMALLGGSVIVAFVTAHRAGVR